MSLSYTSLVMKPCMNLLNEYMAPYKLCCISIIVLTCLRIHEHCQGHLQWNLCATGFQLSVANLRKTNGTKLISSIQQLSVR